jgi:YtcA-like protein
MIRKTGTSVTISLILMASVSCSRAPAIDVMGSLFPAWLLCIALGAVFSTVTHWILTRRVINLPFPFLTYPCLGAVYAFTIWLAFF